MISVEKTNGFLFITIVSFKKVQIVTVKSGTTRSSSYMSNVEDECSVTISASRLGHNLHRRQSLHLEYFF